MATLAAEQEEALTLAVIESPDDPLVKQVLADWLSDHGREKEARAYRFCAENDLHPERSEWKGTTPPVTWAFCHHSFRQTFGSRNALPLRLCPWFDRSFREGSGGYSRPTFPEIMLALAEALERCPRPTPAEETAADA